MFVGPECYLITSLDALDFSFGQTFLKILEYYETRIVLQLVAGTKLLHDV